MIPSLSLMPSHILPRLTFTLLSLIPLLLCSCSNVQPQGALKAIMKDKNSESAVRTPEEQKKVEDNLRQSNRQTPIPKEKKGTLGFKIPL